MTGRAQNGAGSRGAFGERWMPFHEWPLLTNFSRWAGESVARYFARPRALDAPRALPPLPALRLTPPDPRSPLPPVLSLMGAG